MIAFKHNVAILRHTAKIRTGHSRALHTAIRMLPDNLPPTQCFESSVGWSCRAGMHVPDSVEERIFADETKACAASCTLMEDNLKRILAETAGCGVPLGINVESVR